MSRPFLAILVVLITCSATLAQANFVTAADGILKLNGRAYTFIGTNYWYGSLLGLETDPKRGIDRLRHELDFLKSNGVTNLRVMAGAEGSGLINGVTRVGPALQPKNGEFDAATLVGLDILLAEMAKRQMKAVIFLSNNWEWSGGFQQYVDWAGLVPNELKGRALNWDDLRDMVGRFYVCAECKAGYLKQVNFVLDRRNSVTGERYIDDPTIMAWELANEPRPMWPSLRERYIEWIHEAASTIKARDKNHLVTIGHEGSIGTEGMPVFEQAHRDPNIDYLTIHIWAKNWEWFKPGKMAEQFSVVTKKATTYIDEHVATARRLNKPLVIEEFGLPRDESAPVVLKKSRDSESQNLMPGSSTKLRDAYFRKILSYVGKGPIAGANFWAFGGTARPIPAQAFWKPGDEWMGDPPMEEQGLNTVFDVDRSTWRVIRSAASGRR
jgi:mannan endo-1,4-beta-mannosidase